MAEASEPGNAAAKSAKESPADQVGTDEGSTLEPGLSRYVVRCEGRWRVRTAPSLNSREIGSVCSGTVVIGRPVRGDAADSTVCTDNLDNKLINSRSAKGGKVDHHIAPVDELWVQVARFESHEPNGVTEIKRDMGSGGDIFCLRRNALGYGLYKVGEEQLDGPLLMLSQQMSAELRADAQKAHADKNEDVSLTWKLLGAAENVGRFFTSMSSNNNDAVGKNQEMIAQIRRRPDDVFEVRQRELLRKSATSLKEACQKILSKAGALVDDGRDLTAGMPKALNRKFSRLRTVVVGASKTKTLVALPTAVTSERAQPSTPEEGSAEDINAFIKVCAYLEQAGGWPELRSDVRLQIIEFSSKHAADLEDHARNFGRFPADPALSSVDSTSPKSAQATGSSRSPATSAAKPTSVFFLPPPPPPKTSVNTTSLV